MRGTGPTGRRKFAGKGWAIAGAMAVLMVASASGVLGQDTAAGLTGASRPDDVIMARQLLMDAIESEMTPIDLAVGGRQMPLADLKARAYMINTLLTAFPHLFPPETKPVTAPDGTPGATSATMAVWDDFDKFYDGAQDAAAAAFDASQAADFAQFQAPAARLRAACDACHKQYTQTVDHTAPPR